MPQIRVSDKLYTKLTLLKPESDSFNAFIDKMYTYFEVTGVDVNSKIISPIIAIQETEKTLAKNDERIIKILMKFRNDYFIKLGEYLDKGPALSASLSKADGITEQEAAEMIEINKSLSQKIKELQIAYDKVVANSPAEISDHSHRLVEKCAIIKARLHELNDHVLPNNLNPENVQIKKAKFQLFYRTTLSDLNDIINI